MEIVKDRESWQAAVLRVRKSWTQLSDCTIIKMIGGRWRKRERKRTKSILAVLYSGPRNYVLMFYYILCCSDQERQKKCMASNRVLLKP